MNGIFRTKSNQWSIGVGLKRSTIYGSNRWMLWVNYGFTSASISWKKNPEAPRCHE